MQVFDHQFHDNSTFFPTTTAVFNQLRLIDALSFRESAQHFSAAKEKLQHSGEKNKRRKPQIKEGSRYSVINYNHLLYLLLIGKLYRVLNGHAELVTGKLAINQEGKIFFLKCVTFINNNFLDPNEVEHFNQVKEGLKKEIETAYRYGKAPNNQLAMRKTEKFTKLYLMLNYEGFSANLLINHERNPANNIQLSTMQFADMAIQFMQRVLEIYRRGDVHRDIKPANFVVEILENGKLTVSVIDFNSLENVNYRGKVKTTFAYLPPIYQVYRENREDYYWSVATDLYAAIIAAEEVMGKMLVEQVSEYEALCYQSLRSIVANVKMQIENSHLHEPNVGHPKLEEDNITQLEERLTDLQESIYLIPVENKLSIDMEREQLRVQAYRIVNQILKHINEQSSFIFTSLQGKKSIFVEALMQDSGFMAIFHEYAQSFSQEIDILTPETLFYEVMQEKNRLIELRNASFGGFKNLGTQHFVILIKRKLEVIQEELPSQIFRTLIQNLRQKLLKTKASPLNFIREAYEVLEAFSFSQSLLDQFETWYKKVALHYEAHYDRFSPKEMAKAAGAFVFMWQDDLLELESRSQLPQYFLGALVFNAYRDAENFFLIPGSYTSAKQIYMYFMRHRFSYILTNKEKWNEVAREEMAERLILLSNATSSSSINELTRIFNDAGVDSVLDFLGNTMNHLLEITRQEGESKKSIFITQQIINQKLLLIVKQYFFDDPIFFESLFQQLRMRFCVVGANVHYNQFLRIIRYLPHEEKESPISSQFQNEEYIKMKLALVVLSQAPLTGWFEASPRKMLAVSSVILYYAGSFVLSLLKIASQTNNNVSTLVQVSHQLTNIIAKGRLIPDYFQREEELYRHITGMYPMAYQHINDDNIQYSDRRIRETFPSFKRYEIILDSRPIMRELPSDLTRERLAQYLLQASEDFAEDIYHTLVCLMAEGLLHQFSDRNCLPGVSLSPVSTHFSEGWNEFENLKTLLGNTDALNLYKITIRYCVTQQIPYCTAQEVLLIVQTLKNSIAIEETELLFSQFASLVHHLIANPESYTIDMTIEAILNAILHSNPLLAIYCQYLVNENNLPEREQQFLKVNFILILSVIDDNTSITRLFQKIMPMDINQNVADALRFILKPVNYSSTSKKDLRKLEKLFLFFMNSVVKMRRLDDVLCIQVLNDFPLFSRVSSSLWNITGLLGKVYTLRLQESKVSKSKKRPWNYPVVFIYWPLLSTLGFGLSERLVTECIEVYESGKAIQRKHGVLRDDRPTPKLAWDSYLTSRAARKLEAGTYPPQTIEGVLCQTSFFDNQLRTQFLPEFFDLVLMLLRESMQLMELCHAPLFPISEVFLKPFSLAYDDPRTLITCSENQLIGLFILGLIYRKIGQQAMSELQVGDRAILTAYWFLRLPNFFAHYNYNYSINAINNLAIFGIVQSSILHYGSPHAHDPLKAVLCELDKRLASVRAIDRNRQRAYVTFYMNQLNYFDVQLARNILGSTYTTPFMQDEHASVTETFSEQQMQASSEQPFVDLIAQSKPSLNMELLATQIVMLKSESTLIDRILKLLSEKTNDSPKAPFIWEDAYKRTATKKSDRKDRERLEANTVKALRAIKQKCDGRISLSIEEQWLLVTALTDYDDRLPHSKKLCASPFYQAIIDFAKEEGKEPKALRAELYSQEIFTLILSSNEAQNAREEDLYDKILERLQRLNSPSSHITVKSSAPIFTALNEKELTEKEIAQIFRFFDAQFYGLPKEDAAEKTRYLALLNRAFDKMNKLLLAEEKAKSRWYFFSSPPEASRPDRFLQYITPTPGLPAYTFAKFCKIQSDSWKGILPTHIDTFIRKHIQCLYDLNLPYELNNETPSLQDCIAPLLDENSNQGPTRNKTVIEMIYHPGSKLDAEFTRLENRLANGSWIFRTTDAHGRKMIGGTLNRNEYEALSKTPFHSPNLKVRIDQIFRKERELEIALEEGHSLRHTFTK